MIFTFQIHLTRKGFVAKLQFCYKTNALNGE